MEVFLELSTIILIVTVVAFVMQWFRQPLIVAYILAGILLGPSFMNVLQADTVLEVFSKIGITILLFIIGLGLNPNVIKQLGKVSLTAAVGQILLTSITGFTVATLLGLDRVAALYTGIAITFSSTITILKLLSDKGDIEKLHAKLAIGLLIVQDLIASVLLIVAPSLGKGMSPDSLALIQLGLRAILLVSTISIVKIVVETVMRFAARSQELLFLFSIAFGLGFAAFFYTLGFSVEIGALVAGVMLSMTPYASEMESRLKPLRDFFIVIFFVFLGGHMVIDNLASMIFPALVLSLVILIANPVIIMILMNLLGFKRRTGYLTGLTLTQMSEFSLILATLGFNLGHLSQDNLSLITLVGLITVSVSSYLILHADGLYPRVNSLLRFLELRKTSQELRLSPQRYDIILFGYDRVGDYFLKAFNAIDQEYLVVDFNPSSIERLKASEIPHKYGDVEDIEFLQELNLKEAKLIVSTVPSFKANKFLLSIVRQYNKEAIVLLISHSQAQALELYKEGATYVITPHHLGADYAAKMIKKFGTNKSKYHGERKTHLEHIEKK